MLPSLSKGMLCLADRNFFGYELWKQARICYGVSKRTCAWRVKSDFPMGRI